MAIVVMPLPNHDFDPTEAGVPWRVLTQRNHRIVFATPDGKPAHADPRTVTGEGLGVFAAFMKADRNGRSAYDEMIRSQEFQHPVAYEGIRSEAFDGMILPGGHASGMRPYLESAPLQAIVADLFERGGPVGAICHGVLVAARARRADGKSILHGRKTTAIPKIMELTGWLLTYPNLGNYYRTYPTPVEDEVRASLARPEDFIGGPLSVRRDSPHDLRTGFTVRDGNYLSARWPGDAHRFASEFAAMLE
jgi:protease I